MRLRSAAIVLALALPPLLIGCDSLPQRLPRDPDGTALNASTSRWRGLSSTGAYSIVRQVTTGANRFSFKETWFRGKGEEALVTVGSGSYEPKTQINVYVYTRPDNGIVVVRTREIKEEEITEDTVLSSSLPIFQVGETITYTLMP
ncbi:MAG: hypothetical protein RLZZ459_2074 [Cyanobacteriota bacterium]|jgi:hypothetical protein